MTDDTIEDLNELKTNSVSDSYTYEQFGRFNGKIDDIIRNVSKLLEDNRVMKDKIMEQDEKIRRFDDIIFVGQSLPGRDVGKRRETTNGERSRDVNLFDLPGYGKKNYEQIKTANFSLSRPDKFTSTRQSFEMQSFIGRKSFYYSSSKWTDIRLAFDRTMGTRWRHAWDFRKKNLIPGENGEKNTLIN